MTTLYEKMARCAVCGTESKYTVIVSTNSFGSPDLDTRPPEMGRSTIFAWVQRCPECGYCASDIRHAPPLTDTIIHDQGYIRQLIDEKFPELANSFLCQAFIEEISGDYAEAAWYIIYASWACDDAENKESAHKCRTKAVDMIIKAVANGQDFVEPHGAETAIQADLLRRAGRIAEARTLIAEKLDTISDEIISKILVYQDGLLSKGDEECHTIAEAIAKDK